MNTSPLPRRPHSMLFRLANSACPSGDRPWLMALWAESRVIESPVSRLAWLFGAGALIAGANVRSAIGALRDHPLAAVIVALALATLVALPSLLGYEILLSEDDQFLIAATLLGGGLLSVIALALLLAPESSRAGTLS